MDENNVWGNISVKDQFKWDFKTWIAVSSKCFDKNSYFWLRPCKLIRGVKYVPSQVEFFAQNEWSHKGNNKGLNRLIDRDENRTSSINAPYLYGECDPRCNYTLQHKYSSSPVNFIFLSKTNIHTRTTIPIKCSVSYFKINYFVVTACN